MLNTFHRIKEFISYQQRAKTKYYIHSPFVYQFYLQVLEGDDTPETLEIRDFYKKLLQNYDKITIDDMGAAPGNKEKSLSKLASKASMPNKYGKVLYRLLKFAPAQNIIELGTCLGIGTAYMSKALPTSIITTIEGSKTLSDRSQLNFKELGLTNIRQITGNFDTALPDVLRGMPQVDFAFIDGNHRYEPTMRYFCQLIEKAHEGTVLVFDDIYWSREMTAAWTAIRHDPRISLTIDIYRFGIVFIQSGKLAKEDFVLRY